MRSDDGVNQFSWGRSDKSETDWTTFNGFIQGLNHYYETDENGIE